MSKPLRDYIPLAKWDAWAHLPRRERLLLIAAYLCDNYRVREDRGRNRGVILDAIIREAGYAPGDSPAWCAILITACAALADYKSGNGEIPGGPGAVRNWVTWAERRGYLRSSPQRGDLCYWLNKDKTGHIGIVIRSAFGFVYSLEGNTSSGEAGSQRDGDGLYRRIRRRSTWHGFVRLPE